MLAPATLRILKLKCVLLTLICMCFCKNLEYQQSWNTSLKSNSNSRNYVYAPIRELTEDWQWSYKGLIEPLGQISGVAYTNDGRLFIFHRNDHEWDYSAFDMQNLYLKRSLGPIRDDVVSVLNTTDGRVIETWGKNMFYMPHGISFDRQDNVWLTDVGLHQVVRFKKGVWAKPDIVLGEAFVPGNDLSHFCKPTDVAIASSGTVYISDGYCNSRIVIVNPQGKITGTIGSRENMYIPHSLTLLESEDLLCVADRENGRVLCYRAGISGTKMGSLILKIENQLFTRVFAVAHLGTTIFLLNIPEETQNARGFSVNLATGEITSTWQPEGGLVLPHDITVSPEKNALYFVDAAVDSPKKLYKFHLSTGFNGF